MALPTAAHNSGLDAKVVARANHIWLTDAPDQPSDAVAFAESVSLVAPHIRYLVRTERQMLGRMVRYLAGQGVNQFLDLGSGIPAGGHVHEIAQAINPGCRVVYVDNEPDIAAEGQEILAGNDHASYLCVDLCRVGDVLDHPETRRLIDFGRPVGILLIETLVHLAEADKPEALVARYVDAVAPGSYLGISHFDDSPAIQSGYTTFERMHLGQAPRPHLRGPDRLKEFFAGLDLVEPGIVPVPVWRPDPTDIIDRNPDEARVYAGLGRKP